MSKDGKEVKSMKTVTKSLIAVLLIVVLVAGGLFIKNQWDNKDSDDTDVRVSDDDSRDDKDKDKDIIKDDDNELEDSELSDSLLTIVANTSSDYGVPVDGSYTLSIEEEVDESIVTKALSIEPANAYSLKKINSKSYEIVFDEELPNDQIVSMTYRHKAKTYGFAFQTENEFIVDATFPSDNETYVSSDIGIEIEFSREVDDSIVDYINIVPEIEGEFIIDGKHLIFVPVGNLMGNTTYSISVDEGYEYNNSELQAYNYSFSVSEYSYSSFGGSSNINYVSVEGSKFIQVRSSETTGLVNTTIYDVENPEETIEAYYDNNIYKENEYQGLRQVSNFDAELSEQGYYSQAVVLPEDIEAGFYLIVFKFEDFIYEALVQVSSYDAYVGMTNNEFVTFLGNFNGSSGGARIYVGGQEVGVTDEDGLFFGDIAFEDNMTHLVRIDPLDEAPLYVNVYRDEAYSNFSHNFQSYLYSDRQLYLPTDTIKIFGALYAFDQMDLGNVELRYENNDREEISIPLTVSENGSYEASIDIVDYEYYSVNFDIYVNDKYVDYYQVYVTNYEKPKYELKAKGDNTIIFNGESVNVSGKLAYFSGEVIKDGKVQISNRLYDLTSQESIEVDLDEDSEFSRDVQVRSSSMEWRPNSSRFAVSAASIDDYYQQIQVPYLFFPSREMIEIDAQANEGNSIDYSVNVHDIDISNTTLSNYSPDIYRGNPINGANVILEIREFWTEQVLISEEYSSIYKRKIKTYDYIRHDYLVDIIDLVTDANGNIQGSLDNIDPDKNYRFIADYINSANTIIEDRDSIYSQSNVIYTDSLDGFLYLETSHYGSGIGEATNLRLVADDYQIGPRDNDKMLVMEYKDDLLDAYVVEETDVDIDLNESDLPNKFVKVVYYDGLDMRTNMYMTSIITYSFTDSELDIEVTLDKDEYRPKDTCNYTIQVSKDGLAVEADVNLSVVDEAFFVLFEDNLEPLDYLYENIYYEYTFLGEAVASTSGIPMGGAEFGGEGDGGDRVDFVDTAYFETITTDANGSYAGSFVLPDNLTSWRLTSTAVNSDVQAGKTRHNLISTLPLSIDLRAQPLYYVDDDIYMMYKTIGKRDFNDQVITYTQTLYDGDYEEISESSGDSIFGDTEFIFIGQLEPGTYKIRVAIEQGDYSDALVYDFEVIESFNRYFIDRRDSLSEDYQVASYNSNIDLKFYNQEAYDIYDELFQLSYGHSSTSNEVTLTSQIIRDFINERLYSEVSNRNGNDLYSYTNEGLFSTVDGGAPSSFFTARLISGGLDLSYMDNQIKYQLYYLLEEKPVISESYMGSLWALAGMGEPVLIKLNAIEDEVMASEDMALQLMFINALGQVGDITRANQLLDIVEETNDFDLSQDMYDGSIFSQSDHEEEQMIILSLSYLTVAKRLEDASNIVDYIEDYNSRQFTLELEQFVYYKNLLETVNEATFTYEVGGSEVEVILDGLTSYRVFLKEEEASTFTVNEVDGHISIFESFTGSITPVESDFDISPQVKYVSSSSDGLYHVGDVVRVEITIPSSEKHYFVRLQNIIPAGFTFLEFMNTSTAYTYGEVASSMHLDSFISLSKKNESSFTIIYKLRATAPGTYQSEALVITDYYGRTMSIGDKEWISIEE